MSHYSELREMDKANNVHKNITRLLEELPFILDADNIDDVRYIIENPNVFFGLARMLRK